jgi:HTH-type transcriptional regulator / antitoxin HigA
MKNITGSIQIKYNMELIKTEKQYQKALERMEVIFDAPSHTKEGKEAETLALLIEEYEKEHYPIHVPDPIEAIRIRMEEMNLKQKDLIGIIGTKGIVSEVLNKKRKLTVQMIRNLSEKLKIDTKVLIQEYH